MMNFCVCHLLEYGFHLAFEKGLSDLKGLVEPGGICDTDENGRGCWDIEIELLSLQDDEAITCLLQSVESIANAAQTFRILNGLAMEEVIFEEQYFEQAAQSFFLFSWFENKDGTYEEKLWESMALYHCLDRVLIGCQMQLIENSIDVYEEVDDYNFAANSNKNIAERKNVELLDDLAGQLEIQSSEIIDYYDRLTESES